MIRTLIAAALAAPLLSGCLIYANDGSDDVVVRVGDSTTPALETVRGARIDGDRLVVRVNSNGCTEAADFAVELTPGDDGWTDVALRRTDADLCKALVPDGTEVSWTFTELGLEPGVQARLVNPTRL